jgi:gluconate 2-dehydrogenase alpha chain
VSGKAGNLQGKKIDGATFGALRRRNICRRRCSRTRRRSCSMPPGASSAITVSTPRAIISQPTQGRPGCTYCGFCQAFGCHVGAKSSILVTKPPEADATGNFKLLTGATAIASTATTAAR